MQEKCDRNLDLSKSSTVGRAAHSYADAHDLMRGIVLQSGIVAQIRSREEFKSDGI